MTKSRQEKERRRQTCESRTSQFLLNYLSESPVGDQLGLGKGIPGQGGCVVDVQPILYCLSLVGISLFVMCGQVRDQMMSMILSMGHTRIDYRILHNLMGDGTKEALSVHDWGSIISLL